MDSEPTMNTEGMIKTDLLKAAVPLVNTRIGRDMDPIETKALAFVIDKADIGKTDVSTLLREQFSIEDQDAPRDVAWKIHSAIHEAKMNEIQKLIEENLENPEAVEKLQAMRSFMESSHIQTSENYQKPERKVYLGGVPKEWLPAWFEL